MDEDTSNTGGDEEVIVEDTITADDEGAQVVTDETGGVTQEEIAKALGPKYSKVAPVKETAKEEVKDDTTKSKTDEDTDTESSDNKQDDTKRSVTTKSADAKTEEVASNTPDFSFTVEDSTGTTFKIQPGDSIEDVLKDFDPKNNGQIIAILDQLREAKDKQSKYESDQAAEVENTAKAERVESIQKGWQDEFKSIGIKDDDRKGEIFKYMAQENDKRAAANRPLIASVEDAKLGLEAREAVEAKEQAAKDAKETARKNGALVGGSSAAATSDTPAYKAGTARNSTQALKAMGVL